MSNKSIDMCVMKMKKEEEKKKKKKKNEEEAGDGKGENLWLV